MQLLPKTNLNENYDSFGEIEITSPEQFVPLFLINFVPSANNLDVNKTNRENDSLLNTYYYPNILHRKLTYYVKHNNKPAFVVALKTYLKSLLLTEFKSYSLILPEYCYGSYRGGVKSTFLGKWFNRSYIDLTLTNNATVLGAYIVKHTANINYFTSKKYAVGGAYVKSTIVPESLIVVKAKHLTKLRTAMYLGLRNKVSIPYTDIKLLRASDTRSTVRDLYNDTHLSHEHLLKEYCLAKDILKYLIPDKQTLTAEQVLDKLKVKVDNITQQVV